VLVPSTRTQLGRRSFHVAAPTVWNALRSHLRSSSISRGQFRAGLKTHIFTQASGNFCWRAYYFTFTLLSVCYYLLDCVSWIPRPLPGFLKLNSLIVSSLLFGVYAGQRWLYRQCLIARKSIAYRIVSCACIRTFSHHSTSQNSRKLTLARRSDAGCEMRQPECLILIKRESDTQTAAVGHD